MKEALKRSMESASKGDATALRYANAGCETSMRQIMALTVDVFNDKAFKDNIRHMIALAHGFGEFEETLNDIIASALKNMKFDFAALYHPLNASSKKAVVTALVIKVIKSMKVVDDDEEEE